MSGTPLGNNLISENIKNSLAPSTWHGYKMAWFSWLTFFNINQIMGSSLSEDIALSFLTTLTEKDFSWSHINKILRGV